MQSCHTHRDVSHLKPVTSMNPVKPVAPVKPMSPVKPSRSDFDTLGATNEDCGEISGMLTASFYLY